MFVRKTCAGGVPEWEVWQQLKLPEATGWLMSQVNIVDVRQAMIAAGWQPSGEFWNKSNC